MQEEEVREREGEEGEEREKGEKGEKDTKQRSKLLDFDNYLHKHYWMDVLILV